MSAQEEQSEYSVTWHTEVTASSPEDAARKVLGIQRHADTRIYIVYSGARELSIEMSDAGPRVLWDSDEQVGSDGMYTAEFWELPPEKRLRWQVSDYFSERLSMAARPHPEGWQAEGLGTDDDLSGPVGFLVRTSGPTFRVTVEPYEDDSPSLPGSAGE